MSKHAHWKLVKQTEKYIFIRDLGPWDKHFTVTNDAEWVVEQLASQLDGRRLFYFDSENELTELIVKDGKFVDFGPGILP